MVRVEEHIAKMEKVKQEIATAKGYHRKDLIRQYNRLWKEYQTCMHLMKHSKEK